nr:MAG TPA: hypothetical protein [Caudoviricetes sp.]
MQHTIPLLSLKEISFYSSKVHSPNSFLPNFHHH